MIRAGSSDRSQHWEGREGLADQIVRDLKHEGSLTIRYPPAPVTDLSNILVALISGTAGGGTALVGQYASRSASRRQHTEDLEQRSVELLASFTQPITMRRAEALQELFDSLQEVLDEGEFSITHYELVRRQLVFVPTHISGHLLAALTDVIHSQRNDDQSGLEQAKRELKTIQGELRAAMGLESIDSYVKQLDQLRADAEVAR